MTTIMMAGWVTGAAVLVPLVSGLMVFAGDGRRPASAMAWGAVPALAAVFWPGAARLELPWVLLGTVLQVDTVARAMLFLTATLWMVAGIYARGYIANDPRRRTFEGFFLLCMAGNVGLVVAADVVSFYCFFALMTFTAYGLVVHVRTCEALRAGRIYVILAVAGEAMLVAGLVLAAREAPSFALSVIPGAIAGSESRNLIIGLLLAGFGIKAGALPLHVWLPLAHPVAPTPASAVLSGCMIKAGLLGWIRFLPAGEIALAGWGTLVIMLGLAAAFMGVFLGLTQPAPKTVLAYSSISQMGVINTIFGVALAVPAAWPVALPAILLFAVHHGFAKGALFLGVGVVEMMPKGSVARRRALGGMVFAAIALAGAPLTSGSVAKRYLKDAAALAPGTWPGWLDVLIPLTSVATTALMAVLLMRLVMHEHDPAPAGHGLPGAIRFPHGGQDGDVARHTRARPGSWMIGAWLASLAAVAVALWTLPRVHPLGVDPPRFPYPALMWDASWPIIAGLTLVIAVTWLGRRGRHGLSFPEIAAGDVLVLGEKLVTGAQRVREPLLRPPLVQPMLVLAERWYALNVRSDPEDHLVRAEISITQWEVGAALLMLMAVLLAVVLAYA